jgi:uncharacterized protein YqgC (DUF456 family)
LEIPLIILGLIMAFAGIVGCILPVLPGPILSYLSLLTISWIKNWEPFSTTFLIIMAGLAIALTILDYIVPAAGAKKYGASKLGIWGSVVGMIIGLFFIPPWGIFIGTFLGALVGELLTGKAMNKALRVGWGVFVGNMVGIGLKLAFAGVALFFYFQAMF